MKKILIIICSLFIITKTSAEAILLHAPFSTTGNAQNIIKILSDELNSKGWNLDTKVTGNPMLGKSTWNSSKKPFLLGWASDTSSSITEPHYMKPASEKDLVTSLYYFDLYVCSNNKNKLIKDFSIPGKIAIGQDPVSLMFAKSLNKEFGVKHKILQYDGSKKVGVALFSGEVDWALTSKGAGYVADGQATCIFGTGTKSQKGIPLLKDERPKFRYAVLPGVVYLRATNFSKKDLEKLRTDVVEIQKNNVKYLNYINDKMYGTPIGIDIKGQVDIIKKLDSALK